MENQRSHIPPLIGKEVVLWHLKTICYNGARGFVDSFDESSQRFLVQMNISGEVKKFKACNLQPYSLYAPANHALTTLCSKIEVESLPPLLDFLKKNKNLREIDFFLLQNFSVQLSEKYPDRDVHIQVLQLTEKVLEICPVDFVTEKANLKFQIMRLAYGDELKSECELKKITDELLKNHYGNLSRYFQVFKSVDWYSKEEKLKIYFQVKDIILSRNYPANIKLDVHYIDALNFFHEYTAGVKKCESEVQYLFEKLEKVTHPYADEARMKAMYILENWQPCLFYAKRFEEYFLGHRGNMADYLFDTNLVLTETYVAFGNIKEAEKYIRKAKRGNTKHKTNSLKQIEKQIKRMKQNQRFAKSKKPLKKCSYTKCRNKESRPNKFKYCDVCKTVAYCSRKCQRTHWKLDHKFKCSTYQ